MKKFLTAVLALSLCGIMFTACGNEKETTEKEETTTVSEIKVEAETTIAVAETTIAIAETEATEAETEATKAETGAAASAGSYESLDAFVNSGEAFNLEGTSLSAADSLTYNFVMTFKGADAMYLDVEATDGSMSMVMGMKGDMVAMNMFEEASDTKMNMIFKDSKMYLIDESTKSGYYMTADESMMDEFNVEELLGEVDFDAEIESAEDVRVAKVEIGGEEYTFEIAETNGGFLFDKNEKLCAILSNEIDSEFNALKVNDFSSSVPDSVFEIPSDYTLIDLESAMAE